MVVDEEDDDQQLVFMEQGRRAPQEETVETEHAAETWTPLYLRPPPRAQEDVLNEKVVVAGQYKLSKEQMVVVMVKKGLDKDDGDTTTTTTTTTTVHVHTEGVACFSSNVAIVSAPYVRSSRLV